MYMAILSHLDQVQLQQDLLRLAEWEKSWDMTFHFAKLTMLPVMNNKQVLDFDYKLHSQTLAIVTVTSAKYLGITIHKEASWDSCINTITAKANKTQRFLRHNLQFSSTQMKEMATGFCKIPKLKYESSVRDPYLPPKKKKEKKKEKKSHIDKIESIERKAAHFVLNCYHNVLNCYHNTSSVSAMINQLNWPTLQQRWRMDSKTGNAMENQKQPSSNWHYQQHI